jgi:hypothetical protein
MDFESEWPKAFPHVLRYCQSLTRDSHLAEEATAETGRRAWLGFPKFRGHCTFLTWVIGIARKVVWSQRSRKPPPVVSLSSAEGKTTDPPAPKPTRPLGDWLTHAVADAVTAGELSQAEGVVLTAAANDARPSWDKIGVSLGWTPANCAVVRFRALAKLRVFLFLHRPQFLGGAARISAAFDEALKHKGADGLTQEQARTFRRMVIDRDHRYRTVGWSEQLRNACERVIRFVPLEESDPS